MKINLIFKNFIILISITAFLKGFYSINFENKNEDFKNKYGVELVLAK